MMELWGNITDRSADEESRVCSADDESRMFSVDAYMFYHAVSSGMGKHIDYQDTCRLKNRRPRLE